MKRISVSVTNVGLLTVLPASLSTAFGSSNPWPRAMTKSDATVSENATGATKWISGSRRFRDAGICSDTMLGVAVVRVIVPYRCRSASS